MTTYLSGKIIKINELETEIKRITNMVQKYAAKGEALLNKVLGDNGITQEDFVKYIAVQPCNHKTSDCCSDNNENTNNADNSDSSSEEDEYNTLLRSMYKELSIITHPDKGHKEYEEKFKTMSNAYQNGDLFGLIMCGYDVGINFDNIDDELLTLIIEKKIFELEKQLNSKKNLVSFRLLIGDNIDNSIYCWKMTIKYAKESEKMAQEKEEIMAKVLAISQK